MVGVGVVILLAYATTLLLGALTFSATYFSSATLRGRPLVSCYMAILLLIAFYFFLPAMSLLILHGGDYVWARGFGASDIAVTSSVCILALGTFALGYVFSAGLRMRPATISEPAPPSRHIGTAIAWLLIGLGIAIKLYLIFTVGGFNQSIVRLSAGIRQTMGMDDSTNTFDTAVRYLSGVADAAATWLLLRGMYRKQKNPINLAIFFVVIGLSFFGTGKRLYILWPFVCTILGYHFYVRPLKVKLLPFAVVAILLAGFGSLMFRILLPASYANADIDLRQVPWAEGSLLKFYLLSLEFASFEILTFDIHHSDTILGMFGGRLEAFYITNIQPLSFFVPRIMWPSKPLMMFDLSHANRAAILGGGLADGGGISSTVLGTMWTIGGPLCLVVVMATLGAFSGIVDRAPSIRGTPSPARIVLYSFVVVVCFHFFRQGTIGWTVIITVFQQIGALGGFVLLSVIDPLERHRRVVHPSWIQGGRPITRRERFILADAVKGAHDA